MKTVLITGITGLIARHIAIAFLNAGYRVKGSVRNIGKADGVRQTLSAHATVDNLEFAVADLLSDDGWDEAVEGCEFVVHAASPNPVIQPRNEDELVRPALDGTMRVLGASHRQGVKRFVHTSSGFAVFLGHPRERKHFDARDWSDLNGRGITPYCKSKTLSERAVRAYIGNGNSNINYVSINPGYVFGPALDRDINSSTEMIRMFLAGKYPGAPRLWIPAVDIRDVAALHLAAVETEKLPADRFLAVAESLWMVELTRALRSQLGKDTLKSPARELPDWLVRLIGMFDPAARSIQYQLGKSFEVDAEPARRLLGRNFITGTESAVACAKSLVDMDMV